jgi:hypothetical protein
MASNSPISGIASLTVSSNAYSLHHNTQRSHQSGVSGARLGQCVTMAPVATSKRSNFQPTGSLLVLPPLTCQTLMTGLSSLVKPTVDLDE